MHTFYYSPIMYFCKFFFLKSKNKIDWYNFCLPKKKNSYNSFEIQVCGEKKCFPNSLVSINIKNKKLMDPRDFYHRISVQLCNGISSNDNAQATRYFSETEGFEERGKSKFDLSPGDCGKQREQGSHEILSSPFQAEILK